MTRRLVVVFPQKGYPIMLIIAFLYTIFGLLMQALTGTLGWFKPLGVYLTLWSLAFLLAIADRGPYAFAAVQAVNTFAIMAVIFGGGAILLVTVARDTMRSGA